MLLFVSFWFALAASPQQIVSVRDKTGLSQVVAANGGSIRCVNERTCFVEGVATHLLRPFAHEIVADTVMNAAPTAHPPSVSTVDCGALWELSELHAEDVWSAARGEHAPLIAVLDAGFRADHPDLIGRIDGQWDYGEDDAVANVAWLNAIPHHGTFILGLIAARADNNFGRAGIAPNARVFASKIADDNGALYFSYAVAALAAIADGTVPARIVSYSLSAKQPPQAFKDAIGDLEKAGVVVVAAASNCSVANCFDANNDDYPLYPTNHEGAHLLSVASASANGGFNSYSHFGPSSVDLAAPGVDLCSLSASNTGTTFVASGTSYAAPLVAGAAALVWEAHPDLTHLELVRLIKASAHPSPAWKGRVVSGGVLDVQAALATPVPRLSAPTSTTLLLENAAAEGEVQLLFFHESAVALERPAGVRARPFAKNEVLALPGLSRAPSSGTLWTLTVPAHSSVSLQVKRNDPNAQTKEISVRALVRAQALTLGSPQQPGENADASGFPALVLQLPEARLPPVQEENPATTIGSTTGVPIDPPQATPPAVAPQNEPPLAPKGCASAQSAFGWIVAAVFVLRGGRRHERHRSKDRRAFS